MSWHPRLTILQTGLSGKPTKLHQSVRPRLIKKLAQMSGKSQVVQNYAYLLVELSLQLLCVVMRSLSPVSNVVVPLIPELPTLSL